MSIFNVNSGSIDELFSKKVLLNDKDVEQTLSTEYGRLYFDTSQDMDSDPGSNNFRISGPSWDLISSAAITISKTNIVSAKQTKYTSVLDILSAPDYASGYKMRVTSVSDPSVYKVFELVKIQSFANYIKIWVKDIETGWNNLRLEQLPGDGEEFDLDFISPLIARIERFEFTTSQNWTPPNWANKLTMVAVGSGGGGGGGGVTHIAIGPEQWAYGGGGGAGGNIAVTTINKKDLPRDSTTGELNPLSIVIGKAGSGGRGGSHPGARIVPPESLWPFTEGDFYDNNIEQECSIKFPRTELEISNWNQKLNRFTQPGLYGYGYAYIENYGNTAVKYGKNGEDGGAASITNSNNDLLVNASGGKGGSGGKISSNLCVKDFYPIPQTKQDRKTMAPGGKATAGNSVGDMIILGGPGAPGSVPANVNETGKIAANFAVYPDSLNQWREVTGSGNDYVNNSCAPLFPFGIEGKNSGGNYTIWPKPELPYNDSWEEPGEFGIPGGGGGAGVGRWLTTLPEIRLLQRIYSRDWIDSRMDQYHPTWRSDYICWGDSMKQYNASEAELYPTDDIQYQHSINDVNDTSFLDWIGITDSTGCLPYPRYFYANPQNQWTFPSYNTKIRNFYGIQLGVGGTGGSYWLEDKPSGYTGPGNFLSDQVFEENRMAYTSLMPPTTGSGYGVGGGGGQGMQYMYGTKKSVIWYECGSEGEYKHCHPLGSNSEYRYQQGKSGADGAKGFVVVICES
jgi:hypothetical protein